MIKRPTHSLTVSRTLAVFSACLVLAGSSVARAQLLWSFEPDLEGWSAGNVTLSQSTFGATDGSMAMLMDNLTSTFKNDVGKTGNFGPSTAGFEDAFSLLVTAADVIAGGGTPNLEFDLTFDLSGIDPNGDGFMQLGMYLNSSTEQGGDEFPEYETGQFIGGNTNSTFPILTGGQAEADGMTLTPTGVANQYHAVVPLGLTLTINPATTFFDIGFKSNGGWAGTVDMAIDNIRLSGLPEFTEETIFSWETPDDPNTLGVNEQFENWTEGFAAGHAHTISSSGATDGSSSLQIDRQSLNDPNGAFSWGSQFTLSSDIDPDPNVELIDPTLQGQIDNLVGKINGASSVAFDVRFDDSAPFSPTFTDFGVHFSDDQETFFDGFFNINGFQPIGATATVTVPLSGMVDDTLGMSLAEAGLSVGTNSLRIGISTSTDGAGIYQIDNFRLLTEVVSESADFDGDGFITGSDFLIWQRNLGLAGQTDNSNGDANGDGIVNKADLGVWETQYGNPAPLATFAVVSTVPEPSAWMLAVLGCAIMLRRGHTS